MTKKITALILSLFMLTAFFGCAKTENNGEDKKLSIVCTVFPQYDWVRSIAGEKLGDIDLTLLMDSGTDLHSYQPSATDIVKISEADIFIYVGGESDKWVKETLEAGKNQETKLIDMMSLLGDNIYKTEPGAVSHDHSQGEEEEHHHHIYDEHIWLSPARALIITEAIKNALCEADSENSDIYENNYAALAEDLKNLDAGLKNLAASSARDTVIFADRFPFIYLMKDYGINYYSAFSGCSAESEASFETVTFLSDKAKELDLKVLLITETGDGSVAETINKNSGSTDRKILVMNAMQSVTKEKLDTTYTEIMEENIRVLGEALK